MNAFTQAPSGSALRQAKFVTAVWGQAYIERFATLSLPSFLAPGNLPALAAATQLETVILTRKDDIAFFEQVPALGRLRAICPVRFIAIDDLVTTGIYGVTLTLAYARAVIDCGGEMLNTHFVFMNADFVLADGSLRSLSRHICAGRSIVLGPSFRATAEAMEPTLRAAVDENSVLAIAPRQLTAMSLPHAHPTTDAKIRNQEFVHSSHPNQFFWWVDKQTLLGRYYLIFMLCLKPSRIVESINSYCDYSFIPEMCPDGDEVAMGDSDEFFMLELQSHDQELEMLRLGHQSNAQIARSLGEWTTAEHRRAAGHDIVFHAADVPPGIEAARKQASDFVADIARRLRPPRTHAGHTYWVRGVAAWREARKAMGLDVSPPELVAGRLGTLTRLLSQLRPDAVPRWAWYVAYASYRSLLGKWPMVSPLHYSWIDRRHLEQLVRQAFDVRGGEPVLVVRGDASQMDPLIEAGAPAQFATVRTVLHEGLQTRGKKSNSALIYLVHGDLPLIASVVEKCRAAMAPGAVCHVFVHERHTSFASRSLSKDLIFKLEAIAGTPSSATTCTFAGGTVKRDLQNLFECMYQVARYRWLAGLPWLVPMLAIALPATALVNLQFLLRGPRREFVSDCSSIAIRFDAE